MTVRGIVRTRSHLGFDCRSVFLARLAARVKCTERSEEAGQGAAGPERTVWEV